MDPYDCVPGGAPRPRCRLFSMRRLLRIGALTLAFAVSFDLAAWAAEETTTTSTSATTSSTNVGPSFSGNVSWYGAQFHGRKTASGEIFDMKKFTAAHKKLPFGTKILIENPRTGKSVLVKVNDRGPYAKGRVLDLSRGAAEKLGILLGGVAFVDCTILGKGGTGSSSTNKDVINYLPEEHFLFLAISAEDQNASCEEVCEDSDTSLEAGSTMISFVD